MSVVQAPTEQHAYLGRQAIFDRETRVEAYELLYRDGLSDVAKVSDNNTATRSMLVTALTEFGLDTVSDGRDVFVNFGPESLGVDFVALLPRERTVIEVLETVEPDCPTVLAFETLKAEGYRLALDDFVFAPSYRPLLDLADIVKVDLRQLPAAGLANQVASLREHGVTLLAEKVETKEEYELCRELGFDLFQGWFFCRPQLIEGRALTPDRVGTLRLVSELQRPDIELEEVASLISQDMTLSLKLLKYINSSACGIQRQIESIRHAAALVGRNRLRVWATLLGLGGLSDKPRELLVAANVRGRMCEEIGAKVYRDESGAFFTVGMFSLLDAMLDMPLDELVAPLPLSSAVTDALLDGSGALGDVLRMVQAWETDSLDSTSLSRTPMTVDVLRDSYKEALRWTNETMQSFSK